MATIRTHAQRIVSSIDPELRSSCAIDPIASLTDFGLTAHAVPELSSQRGAGGMCDGLSFTDHGVVLYAPTENSRRQNFTVLHELAHHLVEDDDEALIWLADQPQTERRLEELCEQIAANLLIPDEALDAVLGTQPASGKSIYDLFLATQASQQACAIAVATRIGSLGAAILIDHATSTVVHSSASGDIAVYPRRGNQFPGTSPIVDLGEGLEREIKLAWRDQWNREATFYVSAYRSPKRVYAVLCETDHWKIETFHNTSASESTFRAPVAQLRCQCGYTGAARGYPCDVCQRPFCPRCKNCDCQRRDARQVACKTCFINAPTVDLVDGVCSDCR